VYLTLRRGDRLPTVALAQARLLDQGGRELTIDGLFGERTEKAVLEFQAARSLPKSGCVDPPTWAALAAGNVLHVVDAIDAADITVLQEDGPYLSDGHSKVVVSWGMSRGTRVLIQRLVSSNPPASVALLRLHGHGSPGHMVVAAGKLGYGSSMLSSAHLAVPDAIVEYTRLGSIMKPYGSIELHGCRVGLRANGQRLLQGLAQTCRVPVSAGLHSQMGGRAASRFERSVRTCFPRAQHIRAWAGEVFNACEW